MPSARAYEDPLEGLPSEPGRAFGLAVVPVVGIVRVGVREFAVLVDVTVVTGNAVLTER
jgi:hypothetical protein